MGVGGLRRREGRQAVAGRVAAGDGATDQDDSLRRRGNGCGRGADALAARAPDVEMGSGAIGLDARSGAATLRALVHPQLLHLRLA